MCRRRVDDIVINGFENHSIYLSHLIPLHGVRSGKDLFPTEEPNKKDKNKLKDVLEVFEAHFTPLQSMIHSWYNLGALHSHHCKDQADFMSQLRSLSNYCAFTNADEVVKFLFLIHNSHKRVQDQLLKDVTKNSSLTDCLLSARQIEAHIQRS